MDIGTKLFDKNGREYQLIEETEKHYIVYEIVSYYDPEWGDSQDVGQRKAFLKEELHNEEGWNEKYNLKIVTLKEEIAKLEKQRKVAETELQNAKSLDVNKILEDRLKDRLKEIPNLDVIVKALTGQLEKYYVVNWRLNFGKYRRKYIAIDLENGAHEFLYKYTDKNDFSCETIHQTDAVFNTQEEAEQYIINRCRECSVDITDLNHAREIISIFKKHNESVPNYIEKQRERFVKSAIDSAKHDLERNEKWVQDHKNNVESYKKKVELLQKELETGEEVKVNELKAML